jgi:hypothetical protein
MSDSSGKDYGEGRADTQIERAIEIHEFYVWGQLEAITLNKTQIGKKRFESAGVLLN